VAPAGVVSQPGRREVPQPAGRHYDRLPSSMIPRARGRGPRRPDRPGSGGLQRDNVPTRDYCPPTSPVRGEAAQSRHGGRSVRAPHFGLPDRHSCERPPPLRLKSARGTELKKDEEKGSCPGATPLAGTGGRASMPTPSVGSGVGAMVKWKGSRNRSQPRHSGGGRNPGSFAEPSSMQRHQPAPYAGALHLDPGLRRGDGGGLGRRFELRHSGPGSSLQPARG
jgi:hypothetical protein